MVFLGISPGRAHCAGLISCHPRQANRKGLPMIKVALADPADLMLVGMKYILSGCLSAQVVGECNCEAQVIALVNQGGFDVLILDQTLARNSARFITDILRIDPRLGVLINSPTRELRCAISALRAGAKGYITKNCGVDIFLDAVSKVGRGRPYISSAIAEQIAFVSCDMSILHQPHTVLSAREREVFDMIVSGISLTEIATTLHLSIKTVSTHKSRILQRMQMTNLSELIQYAIFAGILPGNNMSEGIGRNR